METLRTFGRGDLNRLHGAVLRIVLDVGRANKRLPTPFITLLGHSDTRAWFGEMSVTVKLYTALTKRNAI